MKGKLREAPNYAQMGPHVYHNKEDKTLSVMIGPIPGLLMSARVQLDQNRTTLHIALKWNCHPDIDNNSRVSASVKSGSHKLEIKVSEYSLKQDTNSDITALDATFRDMTTARKPITFQDALILPRTGLSVHTFGSMLRICFPLQPPQSFDIESLEFLDLNFDSLVAGLCQTTSIVSRSTSWCVDTPANRAWWSERTAAGTREEIYQDEKRGKVRPRDDDQYDIIHGRYVPNAWRRRIDEIE